MKLELFKKDYMILPSGTKEQVGYDFILFNSKYFSLNWFTDCGEWFIYITICNHWWRFSGAGYLSSRMMKR